MGFRTITVNTHCKLSYKNNHLLFRSANQTEMIHLSEIDILICETTDIVISTMLMSQLADYGVTVIFCDEKRLPKSMMMPYYARHDTSLKVQKQIEWSDEKKAQIWTEIIQQKINNQARILKQVDQQQAGESIVAMLDDLSSFDPANVEGHAARTYFNALFGNEFVRDENNNINAGLDYGYTLIMSMFAREVVKCGCITQLGLKHSNQFNEFNLASDLMEPFRCVVDEIVYEYRTESFNVIKRRLFDMFSQTYRYKNSDMFLTNIVNDYVKKVIDCLHGEQDMMPNFKVEK